MKRAMLGVCLFSLLIAAALPVSAQNRLSIEGGGFFPLGNMEEAIDTSAYIGAAFEFQRMNALGQTALMSFFLRGGYAPLQTKSEVKEALESLGQSSDSSFFEAMAGMKAYSSAAPLFLAVSAGYVNYSPPGQNGKSGLGMGIGLGLSFGGSAVRFAIEGRANYAFMDGTDNLEYLSAVASVGFPF